MVDLSMKNITSEELHNLIKAMDAMRHNWEIVRNILDKVIEVTYEEAHNAKDVDGVMENLK